MLPHTAACAARLTSASGSTSIGSLPPSSRLTGVSRRAARSMIFLPVAVEPVNWMKSTLSTRASPTSRAPCTTSNTGGPPISAQPLAMSSSDSGVRSDGLSKTEQPANSAGITSQ
ncbi:Uncharacterised protein [Mycobacteroides abscessus subsp. abscessus]|nr:Uncharacterised protein [Mycobacteroides abscessus subsp. abscessus]